MTAIIRDHHVLHLPEFRVLCCLCRWIPWRLPKSFSAKQWSLCKIKINTKLNPTSRIDVTSYRVSACALPFQ